MTGRLFREHDKLVTVTLGKKVSAEQLREELHAVLLARRFVSVHTGGSSILMVVQSPAFCLSSHPPRHD